MTGTSNPIRSARAPGSWTVGTWELDDFFRDLRRSIVALESAWSRGDLGRRLGELEARGETHPAILGCYRRLHRGGALRPTQYRERAIHALIDRARDELFHIETRFEAQPANFPARRRFGAPRGVLERDQPDHLHGLTVRSPRGEVYLRMDQVSAVRAWGTGFLIDDPELSDRVTTIIAHDTAEQLGYALIGIEKVQRRLERRGIDGDIHLIPPHEGRSFEALIADILNEHYTCARHAPLIEDFFEKTDLRLHARGLGRRRGARVQITRIVDPFSHAEKLAQINGVDEFVVMSPLTIARAFCDHSRDIGLTREDELLFWQCFPEQPETAEELGRAIRVQLDAALSTPFAGPRGPMTAVPEALRLLIQTYARSDAFRATARLRQRQEREAARGAAG